MVSTFTLLCIVWKGQSSTLIPMDLNRNWREATPYCSGILSLFRFGLSLHNSWIWQHPQLRTMLCCLSLPQVVLNQAVPPLLPDGTIARALCAAGPGGVFGTGVHSPVSLAFSDKPEAGRRAVSCCSLSRLYPAQCLLETEGCGAGRTVLHTSVSERSVEAAGGRGGGSCSTRRFDSISQNPNCEPLPYWNRSSGVSVYMPSPYCLGSIINL